MANVAAVHATKQSQSLTRAHRHQIAPYLTSFCKVCATQFRARLWMLLINFERIQASSWLVGDPETVTECQLLRNLRILSTSSPARRRQVEQTVFRRRTCD